jgi:predicted CXXCH cytochrome family protein
MDTGSRVVRVILIFIFFASTLLIIHVMASSDEDVSRQANGSVYVGSNECYSCHPEESSYWNDTGHAKDFSVFDNRGEIVNLYLLYDGICVPCHATGYNATGLLGYDPAEPWNSINNTNMLRIQCEACHGPGSYHTSQSTGTYGAPGADAWPTALTCSGGDGDSPCHGPGGYDDYTYWKSSSHSQSHLVEGANDPECRVCHIYQAIVEENMQGGELAGDIAGSGPVECGACHVLHGPSYGNYLLREDGDALCGKCHTLHPTVGKPAQSYPQYEFRYGFGDGRDFMSSADCTDCHMYGTPDYVYPKTETHDFSFNIEGCSNCHSGLGETVPEEPKPGTREENPALWDWWERWESNWSSEMAYRQSKLNEWQSQTATQLEALGQELDALKKSLKDTWINDTLNSTESAEVWSRYISAMESRDIVGRDGSLGVHNLPLALELLQKAREDVAFANDTVNRPYLIMHYPDPLSGNETTEFSFTVFYFSRTNEKADSMNLKVFVNGSLTDVRFYSMGPVDPKDSYTRDGKEYGVKTTLPPGDHGYAAIAVTGGYETASAALDDLVVKPGAKAPVAVTGPDRALFVDQVSVFDARDSYDPDGEIVSYVWYFGDGNSFHGPYTTYEYDFKGNFTAILIVIDSDGLRSMDEVEIVVVERPETMDPGVIAGQEAWLVSFLFFIVPVALWGMWPGRTKKSRK